MELTPQHRNATIKGSGQIDSAVGSMNERRNGAHQPDRLHRPRVHGHLHKSRRDDLIKPGVKPPERDFAVNSSPGGATKTEFFIRFRLPLCGFVVSSIDFRGLRPRLYSIAAPQLFFLDDLCSYHRHCVGGELFRLAATRSSPQSPFYRRKVGGDAWQSTRIMHGHFATFHHNASSLKLRPRVLTKHGDFAESR